MHTITYVKLSLTTVKNMEKYNYLLSKYKKAASFEVNPFC